MVSAFLLPDGSVMAHLLFGAPTLQPDSPADLTHQGCELPATEMKAKTTAQCHLKFLEYLLMNDSSVPTTSAALSQREAGVFFNMKSENRARSLCDSRTVIAKE